MKALSSLQRWSTAVTKFGPVNGTVAFGHFALPRLLRSNSQTLKSIRVPSLPHPVWLRPATTDWVVMEEVFMNHSYGFARWPDHDRAIREYYDGALQRGQTPVIIDCGAHIGLATLWFAQQYPAARIFSVEPARSNFEI